MVQAWWRRKPSGETPVWLLVAVAVRAGRRTSGVALRRTTGGGEGWRDEQTAAGRRVGAGASPLLIASARRSGAADPRAAAPARSRRESGCRTDRKSTR